MRNPVDLDIETAIWMGQDLRMKTEQKLRMVIRSKPRWMPKWVHERLLNCLLEVDFFPEYTEERHGG